jgi:hypothetical protein
MTAPNPCPAPGPPPMLMGDVLSFKTRLCNNFLETGTCRYAARCRFAHGPSDMRSQDDNFRDGLTSEQALATFQVMRSRLADGMIAPSQPSQMMPFLMPVSHPTHVMVSAAPQPEVMQAPGNDVRDVWGDSSTLSDSGSLSTNLPSFSDTRLMSQSPVSTAGLSASSQTTIRGALAPSQQTAAPMYHVPPSMMQPHPQYFFPQPPMQQFYFQQPQLMGWPGAGAAPVYIQQQPQMQMFMPCQQLLMPSGSVYGAQGSQQVMMVMVPPSGQPILQ